MKGRRIRHFIYLLLLIALDQFTKYLAVIKLKGQEPIKLIPKVLHLHYLENDGAVFGLFSGNVTLLAIFSIIVIFLMVYFYLKLPGTKRHNIISLVLVFIIAGAIGNLIDRIRVNYVIDFIYFALIDFPIFNIADSYVTVSTILFIVLGIFYYKDEDFEFLESKKE